VSSPWHPPPHQKNTHPRSSFSAGMKTQSRVQPGLAAKTGTSACLQRPSKRGSAALVDAPPRSCRSLPHAILTSSPPTLGSSWPTSERRCDRRGLRDRNDVTEVAVSFRCSAMAVQRISDQVYLSFHVVHDSLQSLQKLRLFASFHRKNIDVNFLGLRGS
jgi:hypothetical protein